MKKNNFAIGIDFGTLNCRFGIWRENGFEIICDEKGRSSISSVVEMINENLRIIGEEKILEDETNRIYDLKRFIGRELEEKKMQKEIKNYPFKFIDQKGRLKIEISFGKSKKSFYPEELLAIIFIRIKVKKIKKNLEKIN